MNPTHLFTYGTLQPGFGNHRLVEGLPAEAATAAGVALYQPTHGSFPYAFLDACATTIGTLIALPDPAAAVLARVDGLEGYDPHTPTRGHYRRLTCEVVTASWSGTAWVYIAGPGVRQDQLTRIPGDRWTAWSAV